MAKRKKPCKTTVKVCHSRTGRRFSRCKPRTLCRKPNGQFAKKATCKGRSRCKKG